MRRLIPLLLVPAALAYAVLTADGPPPRGELRIATWNLRNFPGDHDLPWLRQQLADLDADVLALQEIRDPDRLAEILDPTRYDWLASNRGGRNHQHLVLAWRIDAVAPTGPARHHDALSHGGRVRPGLSQRFSAGGVTFEVLTVHLKARPSGAAIRAQQWDRLAAIAGTLASEGLPLLVLGDFNVTGGTPDPGAPDRERTTLESRLAAVGLDAIEVGQCTAYWHGVRYDAWYEPARLDLVFAAGWGELRPRAHTGTHCRAALCQPLRSTPSHPVPSLARGSDHCPVVIDLGK